MKWNTPSMGKSLSSLWYLYKSPKAAVIQASLKQQKFILSSGGYESKIKVLSEPHSLEGSREESFLAFCSF